MGGVREGGCEEVQVWCGVGERLTAGRQSAAPSLRLTIHGNQPVQTFAGWKKPTHCNGTSLPHLQHLRGLVWERGHKGCQPANTPKKTTVRTSSTSRDSSGNAVTQRPHAKHAASRTCACMLCVGRQC